MADQYIVYNSAVPTTACMTLVATGTTIKTLLQLTAASTRRFTVVKWGIEFTGTPAAIQVELIHTTTVAGGSPTAVVPTILTDGAPAALTTAGFSPTSEGSVAATCRVLDSHVLSSNTFVWEWSLGREAVIPVSGVLRVRVIAAVTVNALCFVQFEE